MHSCSLSTSERRCCTWAWGPRDGVLVSCPRVRRCAGWSKEKGRYCNRVYCPLHIGTNDSISLIFSTGIFHLFWLLFFFFFFFFLLLLHLPRHCLSIYSLHDSCEYHKSIVVFPWFYPPSWYTFHGPAFSCPSLTPRRTWRHGIKHSVSEKSISQNNSIILFRTFLQRMERSS